MENTVVTAVETAGGPPRSGPALCSHVVTSAT
jgi:hypothetical protein